MDWSTTNLLAIGLLDTVYVMNMNSKKVCLFVYLCPPNITISHLWFVLQKIIVMLLPFPG